MGKQHFHARSFFLGILISFIATIIIKHVSTLDKFSKKGPFGMGREKVCIAQYEEAIPLLNKYKDKYPSGRNISRAAFFLGKAYLGMGEMKRAKGAFVKVIDRYPNSLEAHKSIYKLGLIAFLEGDEYEALSLFEQLLEDPNGPLTSEAQVFRDYLVKKQM